MKQIITLCFFLCGSLYAQAQDFWNRTTESQTAAAVKCARTSFPEQQLLYKLDLLAFKLALNQAPLQKDGPSNLVLPFPDANGNVQHFRIYKAPVMHPELAAKFPDNESYVGQGIEKPTSVIRFSVTLFGLHAFTLAANDQTYYIDPYNKTGDFYMVYARKGLTTSGSFECLTPSVENKVATPAIGPDGIHKTYRTAICCTVEYSAFHISAAGLQNGTPDQKKAAVMAAITTTITRVNSMFERDLSVSFELVPNNDLLVFIDADNLSNNDVGAMIDQGSALMEQLIGAANYDFGHTIGTSGGGLGGGTPCVDGAKAIGATGLGSPVGDPFDIDYVAHEMGHQFGAAHTFNNSCGGNISPQWAYEPGSGSSIMAYAGICDPNIQSNSNAQFFAGSISQIRSTINGTGGLCAAQTNTGNTAPVVSAGSDYVIPKGTAFVLTGTATDADNDSLLYTWEQYDNQMTIQPPSADAVSGPSFKPQVLTDVPVRYLPQMQDILANNLTPTWEVVSNQGRDYNFAFTVRDNRLGGGEARTDFMKVTASGTAGPFVLTAPNTATTWAIGAQQIVSWDVAGTTANGVNTPTVDILLSTDGGLNFNHLLASNVPNNGNYSTVVPDLASNQCRLMVRGHGNIFFDVSNENFEILTHLPTYTIATQVSQTASVCRGSGTSFPIDYQTIAGYDEPVTFSTSTLPAGITATYAPTTLSANGVTILSFTTAATTAPGVYEILVRATSQTELKFFPIQLEILSADFATVLTTTPVNGATGVPATANLVWTADAVATQYNVRIYADAAQTILVEMANVSNLEYTAQNLMENVTYYWNVTPQNSGCTGIAGPAASFTTGVMVCETYVSSQVPVLIPANTSETVTSTLEVTDNFPISGANVALNIPHDWLGDLTVTLISPAGTEIQLFSQECSDGNDVVATFSDSGSAPICGTPVALSGILLPDTPLSNLNGETATGTWTLRVYDEFEQDGGSIQAWSLELCRFDTALSVSPKAFAKDLSLYPNPNNGNFQVSASGLEDGAYTLDVFDLRGRAITSKKAQVSGGKMQQELQLPLSSGLYLLKLGNETQSTTKKFIVK